MVQTRRRGRTLIVRSGKSVRVDAALHRHASAAGLLLVLLLSLAIVAPLVPRMLNPYDEGMVAYGAERVLHGQRPAVDFYSPYGPGVFYVVAAAYRLFGTRLLVERWVSALLLIIVGGLSYVLLARRGQRGRSEAGPLRHKEPGASQPAAAGDLTRAGLGRWQALRELRHLIIAGVAALTVVLMLASGWWYTPVN